MELNMTNKEMNEYLGNVSINMKQLPAVVAVTVEKMAERYLKTVYLNAPEKVGIESFVAYIKEQMKNV
jgi:hypothetical protein